MKVVTIYTDGACKGNPGPGGWGVVLRYEASEKTLRGGEIQTTNNRMELTAVIEGLKALKEPCKVTITSDSTYVLNGVTKWMETWKKKDWKTTNNKPVRNVDLWKQLDIALGRHQLNWQWVKGHSGHRDNELADQLANKATDEILFGRD
ncbi:MAG: ribonuclease HI [Cellvibrionales bacterium TMED148]|nr:ribonuclease HI [Porticoccaceae bacterium]RPG88123.1 MAG: ribonuclease HI [Cellvibrionales bacterium TMED148]|tara:strand:+ start:74 stop:520 length:447 start_codon:yes stop_codon:yes gene_type:complete